MQNVEYPDALTLLLCHSLNKTCVDCVACRAGTMPGEMCVGGKNTRGGQGRHLCPWITAARQLFQGFENKNINVFGRTIDALHPCYLARRQRGVGLFKDEVAIGQHYIQRRVQVM